MTSELASVYDPKSVEEEIYARWIEAGAFDVQAGDGRPKYCIVIPPPNVTAPLHLGHALNNTLQDVLIRWRRMSQFATLWMPGTDHAGIATQTVVEKRILVEEGRRRTDFERGEFVARVQAWKDEYEARIIDQLRAMGCSCDWRRTRFTMDDVCARAVREAFFRLFRDGLIYRGKRLVNWDPATQTVLADDEVEHETVHGHFWYLRYPLAEPVTVGGQTLQHLTVATTRPETMLGDTAVAMNPKDPRAAALVGQCVRLPIVGRVIPIIADDHVVLGDPDSEDEKARFSTGFLKVTPAHDPDDYQIGERHLDEIAAVRAEAGGEGDPRRLVFVNVMAPDGTISAEHGWDDARGSDAEFLLGMDRFEAREAVVEWFRQHDLLEDVRDYTHEVGHSYRSHVPVEPYLSDQWYVAVKRPVPSLGDEGLIEGTDIPVNSLAGLALKPLLDGRLKFTPERYAATYRNWLEGLRDWPISRQLWWGHQIPIWSRELELPGDVAPEPTDRGPDAQVCAALDGAAGGRWSEVFAGKGLYVLRVEAHPEKPGWVRTYVCVAADSPGMEQALEAAGWQRDGDVLDTWFSSALWPFSTLGWPGQTPEMGKFYPGDVLCTAREIITLWVTRMVMMGQYCCGDIPFADVFIHAMIQDGQGQKMSKSLGNGVDPEDIIHSHGADAMRFTLAGMTTQTQDVRMPVDLICPHTGETFAPKMITNKAGFRVAAPVQASPSAPGRKMVSTYGAASGEASPTDEVPLARNTSSKFDIGRNFCNKLWNASRFAMMNLQGAPAWSDIRPTGNLADAWILSRLNATIRDVSAALAAFRFNELADTLYHFMWDDLCDWYLEIAKVRIAAGEQTPKAVLAHALGVFLRLLHPIAPFITEAIWQRLNDVAPVRGPGDAPAEPMLVRAQWPQADAAAIHPAAERDFAVLQDLVRQVRNARTEHNVPPRQAVDAMVEATGHAARLIAENLDLLKGQATLGEVTLRESIAAPPPGAASVAAGGVKLYVLGIIDVQAELARLSKQAETLRKGLGGIVAKLANESFVARAPAEVVQRERERLSKLQADLKVVESSLEALR